MDNNIQELLFNEVLEGLEKRGLILKKGTIVDSTIVNAPASVRNAERKRDPDEYDIIKVYKSRLRNLI